MICWLVDACEKRARACTQILDEDFKDVARQVEFPRIEQKDNLFDSSVRVYIINNTCLTNSPHFIPENHSGDPPKFIQELNTRTLKWSWGLLVVTFN